MFIYGHRAVIRALIYTAAGEQNKKQEEGKLQDAVCLLTYVYLWGLTLDFKLAY